MSIKIGITERGDAGIDFSWFDKLDQINGAIIISKKLSPTLIEKLIAAKDKVIFHCSCTGWGGTWLEPNNYVYPKQLDYLKELIAEGFPANHTVLRIDPIFPTAEGLQRAANVLNYIMVNKTPVTRIRISIYDEYKHAKERIITAGHDPFYNNTFTAPAEMMQSVVKLFEKYPFKIETCAEDLLSQNSEQFEATGCVSKKDLDILGLKMPENTDENRQNRSGCHCLGIKTELLTERRQCPNGCLYCYWK